MNAPEEIFRIHFETRSNKPDVFRFTEELIASAMTRNGYARDGAATATTFGSDLSDLSWLSDAQVLVTSNEMPGGIYAPFLHPWSTGKELYYNLSLWSAYNVMLMHTVLA